MPPKKRDMQTWYRLVWADTEEDAVNDGLAYVLGRILPDTVDEWEVKAVPIAGNDPTGQGRKRWDVHVNFHRVKTDPADLLYDEETREQLANANG
jgi:hypothetical protein